MSNVKERIEYFCEAIGSRSIKDIPEAELLEALRKLGPTHLAEHHKLDDKAAAPILGVAPATLKNSRYLGVLNGAPTPEYILLGRSVRYELKTLLEWDSKHGKRCKAGTGAQK